MDRSAEGVDIEQVECAIRAGIRLPRFSAPLERQFEADTATERCRFMIRQNYIGLLVYHGFLVSDAHVIGDAFTLDLWMHFGVMTPLTVAVNVVLARGPTPWVRESLEALSSIILALTIVVVTSRSRMPDRDIVLLSMALVVLFANVVQRLRFLYCTVACALFQVIFAFGSATFEAFSQERFLMLNTLFGGMVVFSLLGSYNLECQQRMGYLLRLRERFRSSALEAASLRDALTGIGNRRALDASLQRLTGRRSSDPVRLAAVLLLDIDHFKAFNDINGHPEGDACLKRVAALVAASVHEIEGSAYRFGGEEFLILLDGLSPRGIAAVAEKVRASVAGARIPRAPDATAFVTISVGVASGVLGHDLTPAALIAAADGALYEAKRGGRNQVRSSADRRVAA